MFKPSQRFSRALYELAKQANFGKRFMTREELLKKSREADRAMQRLLQFMSLVPKK